MKLVGILCFYDEPAEWLAECAGSLSFCDHLVAVDGAYALFPYGTAESPADQREAITRAASKVGLTYTLYVPEAVYAGNEVEKRNLSLDLAREFCDGPEDWFVVVDADEVVTYASDWLRWDLAETQCHSATYGLYDSLELPGAEVTGRFASPVRAVYRNLPGLRYEGRHCILAAELNGEKVYVWAAMPGYDELGAQDIRHVLRVMHRQREREKGRLTRAKAYYQTRDLLNAEPTREVLMEKVDGTVGPL